MPILLVVIALLVIGGGVYVYTKNKQSDQKNTQTLNTTEQPVETTQKSITENSDWKTYTNDKYGFTLKYPQDLKAPQELPNCAPPSANVTTSFGFGSNTIIQIDKKPNGYTTLESHTASLAEQLKTSNLKARNEDMRNATINVETKVINGEKASIINQVDGSGQSKIIFFDRGSYLFRLQYSFFDFPTNSPYYNSALYKSSEIEREFVGKMVETIKFSLP